MVVKYYGADSQPIPTLDNTTYAKDYSLEDPSTWPDYQTWVTEQPEETEPVL